MSATYYHMIKQRKKIKQIGQNVKMLNALFNFAMCLQYSVIKKLKKKTGRLTIMNCNLNSD